MSDEKKSNPRYFEWASIIVIPVVLALVGHWVTQAVKEREVQGKFVELAIGILKEPPSEESQNLRKWAISIVDKHSGVPMSDETREELQNAPITGIFRSGSQGSVVIAIQERLVEIGYLDASQVTGYYGPSTEAAVRSFQADSGLTVDGIVGQQLLDMLFGSSEGNGSQLQ